MPAMDDRDILHLHAAPPPPAPPTQPQDPIAVTHLLNYLHERDVPCPGCGYNLRNLTQPTCPECREPLRLVVSLERPRFGFVIAAAAPGIFAGLFAVTLVIVMLLHPGAPWEVVLCTGFSLLSGLATLALLAARHRFLKLPRNTQIAATIAVWLLHVIVYGSLIVTTL